MGGAPWEPKGTPGEGTHGRGNPWEPKGSHGRGSRTPMGGDPWEPKGSHGRGPLGPPLGAHLKVFCDEVTFKKITKIMKIEFSDV